MQALSSDVLERLNDPIRLDVVNRKMFAVRDDDPDLAALCDAASLAANADYAFFSFLYADHQRMVGCHRFENREIPLEQSIFLHGLHGLHGETIEPFIIEDLLADDRFCENDLVRHEPELRFYAGFPVLLEGELIGSLCVAGREPRSDFDPSFQKMMSHLSQVASALIMSRESERRAEQTALNLARSQRRHDLALRAARIATWTWNRMTDTFEGDELFRRMLGLEATARPTIDDVAAAILPSHRSRLMAVVSKGLESELEFSVEAPLIEGGRTLNVFGRVLELPQETTSDQTVFGVMIDVTDRRLAEEKRRQLLKELNHRVRNTLAMLQSLSGQTMRRSANAEEFNAAFSGRLQALSNAHHLLTEQDWEAVDVQELLSQQIDPLLGEKRSRVTISGTSAMIGAEESVGLALIVHELTTNALRHGALSGRRGTVDVLTEISSEEEGRKSICIDWQEEGGSTSCLEEDGFGLLLIRRSLDKVIGATVDIEPNASGVRACIKMPLHIK
ncbi:sensor histidine kinase [Notoacmeibacter ruber]|uniref:histidine kinase n=1 Tax=Notoacmeibacter ruber TaxID=2670375 RepID=A0A3L7JD17_9HYPH|nr:HWE histidine kinase domain-containing protein [Notoacmeibacter ruber]RLQ88219.1 GAF domain-containing protein [Notoacmeibacter ruber]